MATLGPSSYLLVHDGRIPAHDRLGLLTVGRELSYRPISLEGIDPPGEPLSDLESVSPIPGSPGHYLLLESGNGKPPRRLLTEVTVTPEGAILRIASVDVGPLTTSLTNCEAILCWESHGELRLAIADRGGSVGDTLRAEYVAGVLTRGTGGTLAFSPKTGGSILVRGAFGEHWRACSDLYLDPSGVIWGVCAKDPPGATGPFDSWLYVAGGLGPDGYPAFGSTTPVTEFCGLKVEALAPADSGGIAVASDDEALGGVWRPLPAQHP